MENNERFFWRFWSIYPINLFDSSASNWMVEIQPGLFDSIVTIFKYISVVLIVLWLVHLFEVYRFVDNHSEIVSLLPDGNIYRPFSICFAVDFAILLLITVGYLMKRELNNCQYLTDTENFVYLITTIALLVCSLGYLTCSLLFHQWSSAFSSEFSQVRELAVRLS